MTLRVQLERNPNILHFKKFPTAALEYREDGSRDDPSFVCVNVTDTKTKQILSVFLKAIDLQEMGVSLTTWKKIFPDPERLSRLLHKAYVIDNFLREAIPVVSEHLQPEYLSFFRNIAYANRIICKSLYQETKHLSKTLGVPGMYFHSMRFRVNIFINLKKTNPLGAGSFGKVRKVLWLNAPEDSSKIIAKKVLKEDSLKFSSCFEIEMVALSKFSGKRGVISVISSGIYDDKFAIFLPAYECSLRKYFKEQLFTLSLHEKLNVVSQLLEGLATISEQGIHGDLHPNNILLRRGKHGVEAVISDFGTYRSYGETELGLTTITVCPPEYYVGSITLKHDVWGMGLSLYEVFSTQRLSCWKILSEEEMKQWTLQLRLQWILDFREKFDGPGFVLRIINEMLDPRADCRLSPKEAFKRFSDNCSAFNDNSN